MFTKRYARSTEQKGCFGKVQYYRASDRTCKQCRDYDECGDIVEGSKARSGAMYGRRTTCEAPTGMAPVGDHAGIIQEGETAFERFCYDAVTGACRGSTFEMHDFFCHYRFGRRPALPPHEEEEDE